MGSNCKIIRVEESDEGTFGAFLIKKKAFCVTLELPDHNNQQYISNIPPGRYLCMRYKSQKYDTFQIAEVSGRTKILIHAGNRLKDTEGCVLMGQYWGKLQGERAVLNSGDTFKEFMNQMADYETFWLDIVEV